MKPPKVGVGDEDAAATSRSMRVSTRKDPKISARSLMPTANVPAKSATLRVALDPVGAAAIDASGPLLVRRAPRRSAQTTVQCRRRTSSSPVVSLRRLRSTRTESGWRSNSAPWMSLKTRSAALALAATASAITQATATRLAIVSRLQSVCARSNRSFRHDRPPSLSRSCRAAERRLRRGTIEPAAAAAADLTALAAGVARFVGGPLVRRALFRALRVRPCWRSRAAFRRTSTRILAVLCVLL